MELLFQFSEDLCTVCSHWHAETCKLSCCLCMINDLGKQRTLQTHYTSLTNSLHSGYKLNCIQLFLAQVKAKIQHKRINSNLLLCQTTLPVNAEAVSAGSRFWDGGCDHVAIKTLYIDVIEHLVNKLF